MHKERDLADILDKTALSVDRDKAAHIARIRSRQVTNEIQESCFPNCRPRDAATLLVLDGTGAEPKILMGRRHEKLKFMPGKFVFPGGRVEPQDYLATAGWRMPGAITEKLLRHVNGTAHPQRACALAYAALRETQEETGVILSEGGKGGKAGRTGAPDLEGLSFLARAITPPRRSRRFDTRFFVVAADRISSARPTVDGEFTAIEWLTLAQAREQDLAAITRLVLDDLENRIAAETLDDPNASVPFYFVRGACFHRKLL